MLYKKNGTKLQQINLDSSGGRRILGTVETICYRWRMFLTRKRRRELMAEGILALWEIEFRKETKVLKKEIAKSKRKWGKSYV